MEISSQCGVRAVPSPPEQVGGTSLLVAAMRAIESSKRFEERLFCDPLAETMSGERGFEMLGRVINAEQGKSVVDPKDRRQVIEHVLGNLDSHPGYNHLMIRTMYIDQAIEREVSGESEARQLVILACGQDTRSFRLSVLQHVHVFEMDLPDVMRWREHILNSALREAKPCAKSVEMITYDVTEGLLSRKLESHGFDRGINTVVILEGLLNYLEEGQVLSLLGELHTLCHPPGHVTIVGDIVCWTEHAEKKLERMMEILDCELKCLPNDPAVLFCNKAHFDKNSTAIELVSSFKIEGNRITRTKGEQESENIQRGYLFCLRT